MAAAADAKHGIGAPRQVDDPTDLDEGALWAALAVKPIGSEALKARGWMWESARRGIRLAVVISILIFLSIPATYLFDSFVPLLVGGLLIAVAAVYGSVRLIGSRRELDRAYENADRAMQPLGLRVCERPEAALVPRAPAMPGYSARLRGPLILSGERHGRTVTVHQENGVSEVTVRRPVPVFEARARDGRMRPARATPTAVRSALAEAPNSTRWNGIGVSGGREGITVRRTSDLGDWLCDLWLAERLTAAL
jgi:hypothetical protein